MKCFTGHTDRTVRSYASPSFILAYDTTADWMNLLMRLLNDEWAQISVRVFDEERFSTLANHEERVVHAPSEPGEMNSTRLQI